MLKFNRLEFLPHNKVQMTLRRGIKSFGKEILIADNNSTVRGVAMHVETKYFRLQDVKDYHLEYRHLSSMTASQYRNYICQIYPNIEDDEIVSLVFFGIKLYV